MKKFNIDRGDQIVQRGGYVKGSLLKVDEKGNRTFSEVMPDGKLRGKYTYKDRREPGKKAYRTPWMPIAERVYTEKCNAKKKALGVSKGDFFCEPMVIRLQETTLGNNKHNLQKRQRQYYVIQDFYPEPRRVGGRTYYYEPRSWFMKANESVEHFLTRMYSHKDEKRKNLPPIPENLLDKIERRIMLDNFNPKNQKDPVRISKDQKVTRSTKMSKQQKRLKQANKLVQSKQDPSSPRFQPAQGVLHALPTYKAPIPAPGPALPPTPAPAPAQTIILNVDGEEFDTEIGTDMEDEMVMEHLLAGQTEPYTRGYGEVLSQILLNSQNPEQYHDLIQVRGGRLVVDPSAENITGEDLMEIIDTLRGPGETLAAFLASFPLVSQTFIEDEDEDADIDDRLLGLMTK